MTIPLPEQTEGEIKLNEMQIDRFTCTVTFNYTQGKMNTYPNAHPIITSGCCPTFKRKQDKLWLA